MIVCVLLCQHTWGSSRENKSIFVTGECKKEEMDFYTWRYNADSKGTSNCLVRSFWSGQSGGGCMEFPPGCLVLQLWHVWKEGHVVCKAPYCSEDTLCGMSGNYERHLWPAKKRWKRAKTYHAFQRGICSINWKGRGMGRKDNERGKQLLIWAAKHWKWILSLSKSELFL